MVLPENGSERHSRDADVHGVDLVYVLLRPFFAESE